MHEPIMQSLASKFAKVHQRGLVLGIFNSAGYLGTFLGGLIGGMFYQDVSLTTLAVVIAVVCVLWAILIITMHNPSKKKFAYLSLNEFHLENSGNLNHDAIDEWYVNNTENIIAIKYDNEKISEEEIKNLLK
jgi:MFS family permease